MLSLIINKLKKLNLWYLLWISVFLSEILTGLIIVPMNLIFQGRITYDYLVTGGVAAFLVSLIVVFIIISLTKQLVETEKEGEEALRKGRDKLDIKVHERTAELVKTNEELEIEIAEHIETEEKIKRLYALQIAVININKALLKAKSRHELFQKVCDSLTEVKGIKFVWIGLVEEGTFEVKPVAQSGFEAGYLSSIKVTWDDSEYSRGPTGTAIKTGKPFIMRDIENDPKFEPWREDALKRGYASSMAVPLEYKGEIIGAINVYSEKKDAFGNGEVGFLIEAANDIAIGIKSAEMEESLLESEKRYKKLVEFVTDYIYTVEIENGRPVKTMHGPGCVAVTGYTAEEYKADEHLWYHMIFEEDRKVVIEQANRVLSGEFVSPLEHRLIHKDGSVRWVKNIPVPRYDEQGRLIAFDGLIKDITEQKNLEAQLFHSQKMEAVGQLAGGVAHDFNNILTAIISYGNILKMKIGDGDPLKVYVDQILRASERAANLVQGLLSVSRKQIISLKPIRINEVMQRFEKLLARIIGEDIEFKIMLADLDLTILADSGRIEQVLMNLVTNARDAMPNGGVLTIRTGLFEMGNEFLKTYGYGRAGTYAHISVEDTGVGITEEVKERIFEPFFTTKGFGKGSGLGLSIAYGIIKQHDGYINIDSKAGKGTIFNVYLPLINSIVEDKKSEIPVVMEKGKGVVLVAEDEIEVRKPIKDVLEFFGYEVVEAVDGDDTVDKFMADRDRIGFLILDVVMPKKNGKEAYDEIIKIRPDIKALFISGYAQNIVHKKGVLTGGVNFIFKPLSLKELLKRVREVFESRV